MRTRHLVEPEAWGLIEQLARPPLSRERLAEVRKFSETLLSEDLPDSGGDVVVRHIAIPGPSGAPDVPLTLYVPRQQQPRRIAALLHVHGGGFIAGSSEAESAWSIWLARELQCAVAAPNYRLAPETIHPGPVEDCYAALDWLHANAASLNVDPKCIGVFGGSAGGGLAAAVALLARDRQRLPLCFQCLLYPMLDDRTGSTRDASAFAGEFVWNGADNVFGWESLLGHAAGVAEVSQYAAPARAVDLSGLPPAYIWVGALDLFVDECIEYGRRLLRAEVPTELHVYPGVTHGNILCETAPSTKWCRAETLRALRAAMSFHERI